MNQNDLEYFNQKFRNNKKTGRLKHVSGWLVGCLVVFGEIPYENYPILNVYRTSCFWCDHDEASVSEFKFNFGARIIAIWFKANTKCSLELTNSNLKFNQNSLTFFMVV